jgi:hypothetical protein
MLTRRGLLAGSAVTLLATAFDTRKSWAQDATKQTRVRVVDVHAHWYPPDA